VVLWFCIQIVYFPVKETVILGGNSANRLESACCVLVASTETKFNTSTAKCVLAIWLHLAGDQR